jgi:hypothetical protein
MEILFFFSSKRKDWNEKRENGLPIIPEPFALK